MKKYLPLLGLIHFIALNLQAQVIDSTYVVITTYDVSCEGKLIENVPGQFIRLKPKEGSECKFDYNVVREIRNEQNTVIYPNSTMANQKDSVHQIEIGQNDNYSQVKNIPYLHPKGIEDADEYYKPEPGVFIGPFVGSFLGGPLIGLIPAGVIAGSPPENLGGTDPKKMSNPSYNDGYSEEAHRIKKRRAWTGMGLA